MWEVEYTDEFGEWWDQLDANEQESLAASVTLLQTLGYRHWGRSCPDHVQIRLTAPGIQT